MWAPLSGQWEPLFPQMEPPHVPDADTGRQTKTGTALPSSHCREGKARENIHHHIQAMAAQSGKFCASWLKRLSQRLEHFKTRTVTLKWNTSENTYWCARDSKLPKPPGR